MQLTEKKHTFVPAKRESSFTIKGSYQSGQMGLTVTQLAFAFGGSNPSLPTNFKLQLLEIVISLKFVYASPHYGSKKHSESGLCVRNNTFAEIAQSIEH